MPKNKPTPAEILAAAQEVSPELRERIRIAIGTLEATRKPLTVRALREASSAGTQPVSAVLKAYRAGVLPAPAQTSSWRKLGDLERVAVPGTCEEHDRNLRSSCSRRTPPRGPATTRGRTRTRASHQGRPEVARPGGRGHEAAPTGNSAQRAHRVLREKRPDLHAKVLAGELTAHVGVPPECAANSPR